MFFVGLSLGSQIWQKKVCLCGNLAIDEARRVALQIFVDSDILWSLILYALFGGSQPRGPSQPPEEIYQKCHAQAALRHSMSEPLSGSGTQAFLGCRDVSSSCDTESHHVKKFVNFCTHVLSSASKEGQVHEGGEEGPCSLLGPLNLEQCWVESGLLTALVK